MRVLTAAVWESASADWDEKFGGSSIRGHPFHLPIPDILCQTFRMRNLTVRGKRFRGAHVHSILKKRVAKEKQLNREYPEVWSDFSMEVVDKNILMNDFGFPSKE